MARKSAETDRLTEIETTLKLLVKSVERTLDGHEKRLTKVERIMWLALGMSVAAGAPQITQLLGG
jgi:hypothetical protein